MELKRISRIILLEVKRKSAQDRKQAIDLTSFPKENNGGGNQKAYVFLVGMDFHPMVAGKPKEGIVEGA